MDRKSKHQPPYAYKENLAHVAHDGAGRESILKAGIPQTKPLPQLRPATVGFLCSIQLVGQPLKMDQTELSMADKRIQTHGLENWGHWSKA